MQQQQCSRLHQLVTPRCLAQAEEATCGGLGIGIKLCWQTGQPVCLPEVGADLPEKGGGATLAAVLLAALNP